MQSFPAQITFSPPAMSTAEADQNPIHPPLPPQSYNSPSITILLTVILFIFFFIAFFSIYFCKCFMQNLLYSWHLRHSPSGTPVGPDTTFNRLDPSIIKSFPTFMYSSVKEYRKEKYGLECAICLCEFQDSDILRLLTSCCHVFHQECVDLWLESHKSCPVCRRSLDTPVKLLDVNHIPFHDQNEESSEHGVRITIKGEHTDIDDQEQLRQNEESGESAPAIVSDTSTSAGKIEEDFMENNAEKFTRCKTTGHSIVRSREENKFTSRLPEHVTSKLLRGHNITKSCTTFGEFKSKRTTMVASARFHLKEMSMIKYKFCRAVGFFLLLLGISFFGIFFMKIIEEYDIDG